MSLIDLLGFALTALTRHRLRSLRRACRDLGADLLHSPVTAVPGVEGAAYGSSNVG